MDWLNYHHLLYFWSVAKAGSITAAAVQLRLSPPTISTQIRRLEQSLERKLFNQVGRNLVLTETGQVVFGYANEIFSMGQEMMDALRGRPTRAGLRLRVGVADAVSKRVAHRLLAPALEIDLPVHIVCFEGKPTALMARMSTYELDLVLSDSPLGPEVKIKAFNHLLGESGVSIFATKRDSKQYREDFPNCLDRAPFLLPTDNTSLRRSLDRWFLRRGIRPAIKGEFEDSALLKVFGGAGRGLFAVSTVIEQETEEHYGVRAIGRIEDVMEQYYAISLERKLKHPGVVAIVEAAHRDTFG
ncbi:MAG: transcriptional activator NhaR [bacterium]|nr:transcriptional activator NhaR [bacterium]